MKRLLGLIAVVGMMSLTSCETVDSGHVGIAKSWTGEIDMDQVYAPGLQTGANWLTDEMLQFNVKEQTVEKTFIFNDKNNMSTKVVIAIDYNINPKTTALLYTKIDDIDIKLQSTIAGAAKEVIPQFSAVELNLTGRSKGEDMLTAILTEALPEFYLQFKRVRIVDVDIPAAVAKLAEQTAVQLGQNELASKKEAQMIALAKAEVAQAEGTAKSAVAIAKGQFQAAEYEAKAKKLLSTPANIKLIEAEAKLQWAKSGKSPYGNYNMFGVEAAAVVKGLK